MGVNGQIPYSRRNLHAFGKQRAFTGAALKEIAFPLGGIGTGTISLGGRGNLRDWEIYNRPNKGYDLPHTFFAIWAKRGRAEPVARILESEVQPPFSAGGGLRPDQFSGIGRLQSATFRGEYPFAWIDFGEDDLPVGVSLEAFNPFIPLQVEDSSLPVAVFQWKVSNPSGHPVEISLAATMQNPVGMQLQDGEQPLPDGYLQNEYREEATHGLYFTSTKFPPTSCNTGTAALCTSHEDLSAQTLWYEGGWWDAAHLFWDRFSEEGRLHANTATARTQGKAIASLALHVTIPPRRSVVLPLILAWHTPYLKNGWSRGAVLETQMKRQFRDAWHAAEYAAANLTRLRSESMQWHDALFSSSLPSFVIDAATSQASILRTQTCLRLADGDFYAYEGCGDKEGCCSGNCGHVWNYEQALAFLFPSLERSMRRTDFGNVLSNGMMPFRTGLPRSAPNFMSFACGDGQMGNIIQAYRDWQFSGDDGFLKEIWPRVKRALEYAWTEPKGWDPDKDGVMEGVQHNTYDIEFYGPNTMMGAMYLGALRAAEEMAHYLGESDEAAEYREVYEKGRARTEAELWNGEYYIQKVEVMPGVGVPDHLKTPGQGDLGGCAPPCDCSDVSRTSGLTSGEVMPKYQYGDGCLSDQLLGQWASHVAGLGHVLSADQVRKTMESIFRNNWRPHMRNFHSVQRIYALNDEAGLLLCTWPKGNRPALPFVYCDEVWTGIEYQVAAHLVYEGLVDEGLAIVKGVRDRHDGVRRNPWNEFECGHHYARALSSWSVLLALSGFRYSAISHTLAFSPRLNARAFRCAFTTGSAWGEFHQGFEHNSLTVELSVRFGELTLQQLDLTWPGASVPRELKAEVRVSRRRVEASLETEGTSAHLILPPNLRLAKGETLKLSLGP